jgi:hypothetical protein
LSCREREAAGAAATAAPGSYRRKGEHLGAGAALLDVLTALASYQRQENFSRPCGVRYTDLAASGAPES